MHDSVTSIAPDCLPENQDYLSRQLITYIGNKRNLLELIGQGLAVASRRLRRSRLRVFDVFSGSGVVARYCKRYASSLVVNDLELYSSIINQCYLANKSELDMPALIATHQELRTRLQNEEPRPGFIQELYAPQDDAHIQPGERVFYTRENALFLDSARQYIAELPTALQAFFLAPLLSEASIHANTAGVFKGFYKDRKSGIGEFGGCKQDALSRIKGRMDLPLPLFSRFEAPVEILQQEARQAATLVKQLDVAYLDPPYNQHPYGSNYFMLNLLAEYRRPQEISQVSGIPVAWNRSDFNKAVRAEAALRTLVERLDAKFLLISFNSDGFIKPERMTALLESFGRIEILEQKYNTFRGSRNLAGRSVHVKEYLYIVEKN
ncbi:MAG: DNA adenine methylase [Spirochaetes bacterium]|nr:DNA adenine methylase [Spirochaetota bacterium]